MSRSAVRTQKRRAAHARGEYRDDSTPTAEEVVEAEEEVLATAGESEAEVSDPEPEAPRDPDLAAALDSVREALAGGEVVVAPEPSEQMPRRNPSPQAPDVPELANASQLRWEATFAPEGRATDDGRMFWPGAISWRELPLSLMAMTETSEGGHIGAELAGRIDKVWRDEKAGLIRASGVFDDGEYGAEIARLVGDKTLTGLSVDIAARQFEIVPRAQLFDEEGNLRADALDQPGEEPDLLDILFGEPEDMVFVVTDGVIGMATVCPFPAFEDAEIALSASALVWRLTLQGGFTVVREPAPVTASADEAEDAEAQEEATTEEELTASAAGLVPVAPPLAWFDPPTFTELTPLTVTDEGQVFGHAAAWGTCHLSMPEGCTQPPHSTSGYAYFLLGEVETEEGETVATGRITLSTNHADRRLGRTAAAEHYDHTGAAVADVVAGEDDFGIWVAGALRPDVAAARVRELRGSVLSGDWRGVNGNLELVALLAVNVPGFPIPRPRALLAAGDDGPRVLSLTAAGLHAGDLDEADLTRLRALRARAAGGINGLAALARGELAAPAPEAPHAYADDGSGHCETCGMTEEDGNHNVGGGNAE